MEKEIRIIENQFCPSRQETVIPIKDAVKILRKKGYNITKEYVLIYTHVPYIAYVLNGGIYSTDCYVLSFKGTPVMTANESQMCIVAKYNQIAFNGEDERGFKYSVIG